MRKAQMLAFPEERRLVIENDDPVEAVATAHKRIKDKVCQEVSVRAPGVSCTIKARTVDGRG